MAGCRGKHAELISKWASLLANAFGVGFIVWLGLSLPKYILCLVVEKCVQSEKLSHGRRSVV